MTHANHITRQQKTWLHRVTCHVGLVFFLPGQVKEGHRLQGQSRHAPRVVGIVDSVLLYAQITVYIHMTDVRSDSSVTTGPSHRARHPLQSIVSHILGFYDLKQSYMAVIKCVFCCSDFLENPNYDFVKFRRRFRMRRELFLLIVHLYRRCAHMMIGFTTWAMKWFLWLSTNCKTKKVCEKDWEELFQRQFLPSFLSHHFRSSKNCNRIMSEYLEVGSRMKQETSTGKLEHNVEMTTWWASKLSWFLANPNGRHW
jgi:hypothetical protein